MARVEPCYWSEGCHIYVEVSLQERRATMKVMLGVSLWARWDATLVLLIITLYKRTDYVIIPIFKPIVFRPWNFCCLRFCVLPFRHFGSIYRRYDRSCRRSGCRRSFRCVAGDQPEQQLPPFRLQPFRRGAGSFN